MKYLLPWHYQNYQQAINIINNNNPSILLYGTSGIGKRLLAQEIINYLLCTNPQNNLSACNQCHSCTVHNSNNHQDIYTITTEEGNVKLDIIKYHLSNSLITTPKIATKKIVYIPYFEQITLAGANALLKTLEEPITNLVFIIVTDNITSVIPTILSRCIKLKITSPSTEEANQFLQKNTSNVDFNNFWFNYFGQAPIFSPTLDEEQLELITSCLLKPSISNIFKTSAEFDGKKISFSVFIDFFYKWISYLMQRKTSQTDDGIFHKYDQQLNQILSKMNIEKMFNLQDDLMVFNGFLQHPLNFKLQIENILFKYQQCFQ